MVFLFKSFLSSDPFMTCGDPTLFFATSVTAANDVPPNATKSAMSEMTTAGDGRRLKIRCK
jgi:hypothetical protein